MAFMLSKTCVCAQTFQDLNFEQANPVADPSGPYYPNDVTAASALPGWTVSLGNVQQTDVLQNYYFLNQATVDIFGPNYQAAGGNNSYSPGIIDGNYSVLLQAGNLPGGSLEDVAASIERSGHVSATAQSLQFEAYLGTPSTAFSVSMNGNILSPVVLGSGANYTLYGVNVAPYAGTVSELEFSALFTDGRTSEFGLDDISFSPISVVPEPNITVLTAIGGLVFGGRRLLRRVSD